MSLDALSALGDTLPADAPKPESSKLKPKDIVSVRVKLHLSIKFTAFDSCFFFLFYHLMLNFVLFLFVQEGKVKAEKGVRVGERDDTLPPGYRFKEEDLKKLPPPEPEVRLKEIYFKG